jgi:hypothetical protein
LGLIVFLVVSLFYLLSSKNPSQMVVS